MGNTTENRNRTDFSFLGLSEKWITEEADYIHIFEFEKQNYPSIYLWMQEKTIYICSLSFVYVGIIWALHKWMKTREAFEVRQLLFLWSASLALLSMVMFSRILPEIIHINKTYGFYRSYCKFDHVNAGSLFWLLVFVFSKTLEFVDTVFIVLRKNKLTFLHVFHHASVHISSVLGLVRIDSAAKYFAVMNAFIHSIMYTYFALKAAKVKLPKKLSMAITTIQLLQFVAAATINVLVFHAKVSGSQPNCDRHSDISLLFFVLSLVYFGLFLNFFVQAYIRRQIPKSKLQ